MTTLPKERDRTGSDGIFAALRDTCRCMLMIVDVQVDFAAADGAMAHFGADMSAVEPCVTHIRELITAARKRRMPIGWLRVLTTPESDNPAAKRFYARRGLPPAALAVCRDGERGSDYHELSPEAGDLEVGKRQFSGFHGTDLESQLRARRIEAVVLVGLTTECCIDCTARDAFHRGFDVFIVSDACAAYDATTHRTALDNLALNCATLIDTATLLETLEAPDVNRG